MSALGNGFDIIKVGSQKLVQSIPYELSTDHMAVMVIAQNSCFVTVSQLLNAGWSKDRISVAMVCSFLNKSFIHSSYHLRFNRISYWEKEWFGLMIKRVKENIGFLRYLARNVAICSFYLTKFRNEIIDYNNKNY